MAYRVLIVDDEETILRALSQHFTRRGFVVECAQEREEAEALLSHGTFDLLFADVRLTGFSSVEGLELVGFARHRFPDIRVVLLTGFGSPEVEATARRLGADAYLTKPVRLAELESLAVELLERPREPA